LDLTHSPALARIPEAGRGLGGGGGALPPTYNNSTTIVGRHISSGTIRGFAILSRVCPCWMTYGTSPPTL
jgi:hypothetical protein